MRYLVRRQVSHHLTLPIEAKDTTHPTRIVIQHDHLNEVVFRFLFEFHKARLDEFNGTRRTALQLVEVDQDPQWLIFRLEL